MFTSKAGAIASDVVGVIITKMFNIGIQCIAISAFAPARYSKCVE
jgi:hypothetical protein